PSKSRNGWKVIVLSPSPSTRRRTSAGVPSNERRSLSKSSTPAKRAPAIASRFSPSVPLSETVAIAVCTLPLRSVGNLRRRAQLLRGRGAVAEEFEIGGDLLEPHVGADLVAAAAPRRGGEPRRHLFLHLPLADKGLRREALRIERQRVAGIHPQRGG